MSISTESPWSKLRRTNPSLFIDQRQLTIGLRIGQGGFGDVFKAILTIHGENHEVAYKKVSKYLLATKEKDVYREIVTMLTFSIHPNIVTPLGVIADESPDSEFGIGIVMELATEKTLFDLLWMDKQREINLIQRIEIIFDICKGLRAMHDKKFVHGDLKSMNILLFEDLNAKISDFGTAKCTAIASLNTNAKGVGTICWTAPELFMDDTGEYTNSPDSRSDIWALGLVIYELCSRNVPYYGKTDEQVKYHLTKLKKLPDMTVIEDMIPQELRDLIKLCCNFDPTSRWTASQVFGRVEWILEREKRKSNLPIIPRSMNQYHSTIRLKDSIVGAVLAAQAAQFDQLKLDMNKGFDRVHSGLDKLSSENKKVLTTLLAISNDELEYPPVFLILPFPKRRTLTSNFLDTFSTSDTFIVVFICEKTLSYIPYGDNGCGLTFDLLKPPLGRIAITVGKFMNDYGPIFKLAALTLSTVIKLASGLNVSNLLPASLFDMNISSLEFITSYCDQLAKLGSDAATNEAWNSIKQDEMGKGLNEMSESTLSSLAPISKDAYFKFLKFLKSHKFDKHKLQGKVSPSSDGLMHWNKHQMVSRADQPHGGAYGGARGAEDVTTFPKPNNNLTSLSAEGRVISWSGEVVKVHPYLPSKNKYMELYQDGISFFSTKQKSDLTSSMAIDVDSSLSSDGDTIVIRGGTKRGRYTTDNSGEVMFRIVNESERSLFRGHFSNIKKRCETMARESAVRSRTNQLIRLLEKEEGNSVDLIEVMLDVITTEYPILSGNSEVEFELKKALQRGQDRIKELKENLNAQLEEMIKAVVSEGLITDRARQLVVKFMAEHKTPDDVLFTKLEKHGWTKQEWEAGMSNELARQKQAREEEELAKQKEEERVKTKAREDKLARDRKAQEEKELAEKKVVERKAQEDKLARDRKAREEKFLQFKAALSTSGGALLKLVTQNYYLLLVLLLGWLFASDNMRLTLLQPQINDAWSRISFYVNELIIISMLCLIIFKGYKSQEFHTQPLIELSFAMLMGGATVRALGLCGKYAHNIDYLETFVLKSHLGLGVKGDIITLSLSYVPLMLLTIYLRNRGIGKSVLALRTPYNVVMTLFSAYSFATMAMWRFSPNFPGETHNNCLTALDTTFVVGGVTIGSFRLTTLLFYCSKFIEWTESVFLLYDYKPISLLQGFHHLAAPITFGFMYFSKVEYVWIFVMGNSLVNTVMYFYFGCSGVGIKLKLLRPFITSLQIAQFATGMSYLYYGYAKEVLPGGSCATPGKLYASLYHTHYSTIIFVYSFMAYIEPKTQKTQLATIRKAEERKETAKRNVREVVKEKLLQFKAAFSTKGGTLTELMKVYVFSAVVLITTSLFVFFPSTIVFEPRLLQNRDISDLETSKLVLSAFFFCVSDLFIITLFKLTDLEWEKKKEYEWRFGIIKTIRFIWCCLRIICEINGCQARRWFYNVYICTLAALHLELLFVKVKSGSTLYNGYSRNREHMNLAVFLSLVVVLHTVLVLFTYSMDIETSISCEFIGLILLHFIQESDPFTWAKRGFVPYARIS